MSVSWRCVKGAKSDGSPAPPSGFKCPSNMGAVPSARATKTSKVLQPPRQTRLKKGDLNVADVELLGRFVAALRAGAPPPPPTKKSPREDVLLYLLYGAVYNTLG